MNRSLEFFSRQFVRQISRPRFTELVGEPAMQYVARWPMHVARTWLQEQDTALADLAGRLGYRSEAAFSRAFKRIHGESPGRARREAANAQP